MESGNNIGNSIGTRPSVAVNMALWAAFTAMLGIFLIAMPKYYDDLWFILGFREWLQGHGVTDPTVGVNPFAAGIPPDMVCDAIGEHWRHDNGRLCNMAVYPFLLWPKWLGSSVTLLFSMIAVWYGFRISGVEPLRSRLVAVGMFMWTFLIAWGQHCGALVYQFNYPVSSGLLLMLWWLVIRGGDGLVRQAGILILAFVTGWWQEGFSVPALFGALACMAAFRICRTRGWILFVLGLVGGIAVVLSAPAFWRRVASSAMSQGPVMSVFKALAGHPAFVVLCILAGVCLFRHRWRGRVWAPVPVFALTAGLASVCIQALTVGIRRAGWCADVVSIVGVLYMLRHVALPRGREWHVSALAVWIPAVIMTMWHWLVVDALSLKIGRQMRELIALNVGDGVRTVFADIDTFYDMPAIAAGVPDAGIFVSPSTMDSYHGYFNGDDPEGRLVVIPSALRGVTLSSGMALPGGSGWRVKDGYLFAQGDKDDGAEIVADVRMGWGIVSGAVFYCHPFVSETDGKNYYYIYPWHSRWELRLGDIRGVESPRENI